MNSSHYVYRVDHDQGFAPHVSRGVCTLCGCKITTVEQWAGKGSWVVGLGGVRTGRKDTLIYAMKVEDVPPYARFARAYPKLAGYLRGQGIAADAPVLVSTTFYYFGNKSPAIPRELRHIVHPTQGCKKLSDEDVSLLQELILSKVGIGRHGRPNNVDASTTMGCEPNCPPRRSVEQPQKAAKKNRHC